MPTMTPEQVEAFRVIFANTVGFESDSLQSVNEGDLLNIAVACWNAGASALGVAVELVTTDFYTAELLSMAVEEAKTATLIKD